MNGSTRLNENSIVQLKNMSADDEIVEDPSGIYNEYGIKEKGNADDRKLQTEFQEMVYNLGAVSYTHLTLPTKA